jgi:hypothetical protein
VNGKYRGTRIINGHFARVVDNEYDPVCPREVPWFIEKLADGSEGDVRCLF